MVVASSCSLIPYVNSMAMVGIMGGLNGPDVIREAYVDHYDPASPPKKHKIADDGKGNFTLVMPYEDPAEGMYFEKVIFGRVDARPGTSGYATLYDRNNNDLLLSMDATALTGFRTASKSLLFSTLYFTGIGVSPKAMSIYGTSTQALYHANLFASHYPDIAINIIARSEASKQRFAQKMLEHGISSTSITIGGEVAADPDIIVTATSSPTPVVSTENVQSTKLIIAVGSSSGSRSEISEDVVISRDLYVDASVSIDGKGEYRIPLDSNLISGGAIKELHQLLRAEKNHVFRTPALFVSKGLVIEDYAVARRVYEYFKEMNADV